MKIYANAKVNLALDVVRRRADGYHELDMVMAPLSLKDTIDITPNGADTDRITCDGPPAGNQYGHEGHGNPAGRGLLPGKDHRRV
ncbi:hypothetical protein [Faecalibaculum rodentium]|uniref:hypothetical protein n=1 Tax=Faecalibaculum rodentium TaxID=1702221 RepID=UPI0025A10E77|nr:hypothetical protein [Faecalibaculum rodentium]